MAGLLRPAVGRGISENKRDDRLGRHFAGTQGVLARPQSVKIEADDVAAESARANRLVRIPSQDFRTVTPYRSSSYTPSPWPLGIAASANSKSRSSNVSPVPFGR